MSTLLRRWCCESSACKTTALVDKSSNKISDLDTLSDTISDKISDLDTLSDAISDKISDKASDDKISYRSDKISNRPPN